MIENELSFLVNRLPDDLERHPKKEIKQGYFSDMPSPLRIRQSDNKYTLTKKIPVTEGDHSRYNETEMPIKKEEFSIIWPLCKKSLTKTRYFYPLDNNLTAEIDVYHGRLEGLMTVEVEFPNESSRSCFNKPKWFGKDISQEDWSINSALADMTYPQVKKLIDKLN